MNDYLLLALACLAFVGTHFLMSHPRRIFFIRRLGNNGFALVYSVVSLALFYWMIVEFGRAPKGSDYWLVGDIIWVIASVITLLAAVLFTGSFVRKPSLPGAPDGHAPSDDVGFRIMGDRAYSCRTTHRQFYICRQYCLPGSGGFPGAGNKKGKTIRSGMGSVAAKNKFPAQIISLTESRSWPLDCRHCSVGVGYLGASLYWHSGSRYFSLDQFLKANHLHAAFPVSRASGAAAGRG